jgi:hypothetical protein
MAITDSIYVEEAEEVSPGIFHSISNTNIPSHNHIFPSNNAWYAPVGGAGGNARVASDGSVYYTMDTRGWTINTPVSFSFEGFGSKVVPEWDPEVNQ